MFGIPVRVHPLFWLVACVLGMPYLQRYDATILLVWVPCVFVSILVHELGHVLMGRIFGSRGRILLYSFGGLAIGSTELASRWKRIAVLFAGPGAGFLLYGLVRLAEAYLLPLIEPGPTHFYVEKAVGMLLVINLYWGLLNLLPIYPLDGGQISMELFSAASPRNGARLALVLSIAIAALFAINSLVALRSEDGTGLLPWLPRGGEITILLFGMLAVENVMMLQQLSARQRRPWDEEESGW
jgi:membrane-associated protease RseP (regulator of RpoE activity)